MLMAFSKRQAAQPVSQGDERLMEEAAMADQLSILQNQYAVEWAQHRSELEAKHAYDLAKMNDEFTAEQAQTQQEHADDIAQLRSAHAAEQAQTQQEHAKNLALLQAVHATELDRIQQDRNRYRDQHDKLHARCSQLSQIHDASLKKAQDQLADVRQQLLETQQQLIEAQQPAQRQFDHDEPLSDDFMFNTDLRISPEPNQEQNQTWPITPMQNGLIFGPIPLVDIPIQHAYRPTIPQNAPVRMPTYIAAPQSLQPVVQFSMPADGHRNQQVTPAAFIDQTRVPLKRSAAEPTAPKNITEAWVRANLDPKKNFLHKINEYLTGNKQFEGVLDPFRNAVLDLHRNNAVGDASGEACDAAVEKFFHFYKPMSQKEKLTFKQAMAVQAPKKRTRLPLESIEGL